MCVIGRCERCVLECLGVLGSVLECLGLLSGVSERLGVVSDMSECLGVMSGLRLGVWALLVSK